MLDFLNAVLREVPNNRSFVDMALSSKSMELINACLTVCSDFTEDTWIKVVLPVLNAHVNKMGLAVSGEQREQDVVDFVRECARIYYINIDHTPTHKLGHVLYTTMLNCIRHGYIETERFAMLCARVIGYHLDDTATKSELWLRDAFVERICHARACTRAVHEIAMRLINLDDDLDDLCGTISDEHRLRVLAALAQMPSTPALHFWQKLAVSHTQFLTTHGDVMQALVITIRQRLESMINKGQVVETLLLASVDVLRELCPLIRPQEALAVFELILQTLTLLPTGYKGYSDEKVARLVHIMPAGRMISPYGVVVCMRSCGPETRAALVTLIPQIGLADKEPSVRAASLRAMVQRPDLMEKHQSEVIEASKLRATGEGPDPDLFLHDMDIIVASAPALATLCVVVPTATNVCVEMLLEACRVTQINDELGRVHPVVLQALDVIANLKSVVEFSQMALDNNGLRLMQKAAAFSDNWKEQQQSLVKNNIVEMETTTPKGSKKITKKSKRKSGSAASDSAQDDLKQSSGHISLKTTKKAAKIVQNCDNSLVKDIESALKKKDTLLALRLCNSLRATSDKVWQKQGVALLRERVFTQLLSLHLPTPTKVHKPTTTTTTTTANQLDRIVEFPSAQLAEFDKYYSTMIAVRRLFVVEAEEYLQLSFRIKDFAKAKIRQLLYKSTASGDVVADARAFLKKHDIQDVDVCMCVDVYEVEQLQVETHTLQQSSTVLRPPSEASWKSLNVGDDVIIDVYTPQTEQEPMYAV